MPAILLEGKPIADAIKAEAVKELEALKSKGVTPTLAAIQVGENPASAVYIRSQRKSCEDLGVNYQLHELPAETSQEDLIAFVEKLNNDPEVNGVILQMPVPQGIDPRAVQSVIAPEKDVEGMSPSNMGWVVSGLPKLAPCTAMGVVELIKSTGVDLKGQEVVVVGASEIVGKSVALLLAKDEEGEKATVTVCNMYTKDVAAHVGRADILVVAVGKAGLIKGELIKEGALVIDVGINRVPVLDEQGQPVLNEKGKKKMKTVGDVEFGSAQERAAYITPVPGGTGPMTVAILLRNTIQAAKLQQKA